MLRWKKCSIVLLADLLGLSALLLLGGLLVRQHYCTQDVRKSFLDHRQFLVFSQLTETKRTPRAVIAAVSDPESSLSNGLCTMGACFDVARCKGPQGFKVYVYPSIQAAQRSTLFEEILEAIRRSPYVTSNPKEACLLVPSVDTLDRDRHSADYVKGLKSLGSLPHWNGGRNHLLFGQYSGTWPEYSEGLDFPTGQAILARASFNMSLYRDGFDISLPLMHKEHPKRGRHSGVLSQVGGRGLFPTKRKYILAFKGKRYLYGQGSEVRSSLYHLHNNRDVIMLTTCKHNRDWIKYTDSRCHLENVLYNRYDYSDLLENSTFCLVPRGRRLGSFRFLEALRASCIPISLSNGYVLPFSEVIDWKRAALIVDECQLLQIPYLVRRIPSSKVLSLRLHTQLIWDTYFSSVDKVIMTTLQIIRGRVEGHADHYWNIAPTGSYFFNPHFSPYPSHYPYPEFSPPVYFSSFPSSTPPPPNSEVVDGAFTAVIEASRPVLRESSPLAKLVRALARTSHLGGVIILWIGPGPPQVHTSGMPVHVTVMKVHLGDHMTQSLLPGLINTSSILHLKEDFFISTDQANFGFAAWQSFPSRLVGFVGHTHSWDPVRRQWAYSSKPHNYISMLTTDGIFYHRFYGYLLSSWSLPAKVKALADQSRTCLNVVLNFVVSQYTQAPPLLLPWKSHASPRDTSVNLAQERLACLNMAVNAFGYMPLLQSHTRLDPVLYRDNVSNYRKEFRQMENT